MEKIKNKVLLGLAGVLLAISAWFVAQVSPNTGSVAPGGAYTYKNITAGDASTTAAVQVRGGAGTLGSIVVNTVTGVAILKVYDGTTSTTSDATLIAEYAIATTPQTFTLDVAVRRGIVLNVPGGFTGNVTVTSR